MVFKELFDKEFLFESKKDDKKLTKIFYRLDINIKKKEEAVQDVNNNQTAPAEINADATQSAPVDLTAGAAPAAPVVPDMAAAPIQTDTTSVAPDTTAIPGSELNGSDFPLPSVVTEDDDKDVRINDDENIVRKLEGEIVLQKEEVDEIQSIDDIIIKLSESKVDGVTVLDEFTSDILQVIANPATQMQLKDKIDKESSIFAEIIYGKKKEDSVGLRVIKRKGSELLTTSMMIDNNIVNSQYKKDTLDQRIVDYRNDEFEEKK